ncbi:MAG: hypothetical protein QXU18_10210 [Thermoplasmatales archaeon]
MLHPLISPDLLFKVYNIIQEAPDDVFPLHRMEVDFFKFTAKSTTLSPKHVWNDVIKMLHSDTRTEYMIKLNPNPPDVEFWYDKEELFSFLFNEFSIFTRTLGSISLEWFGLRYLARLIFEDLRNGSSLTWNVEEIQKLKAYIQSKLQLEYGFEDVINLLKATSARGLS